MYFHNHFRVPQNGARYTFIPRTPENQELGIVQLETASHSVADAEARIIVDRQAMSLADLRAKPPSFKSKTILFLWDRIRLFFSDSSRGQG